MRFWFYGTILCVLLISGLVGCGNSQHTMTTSIRTDQTTDAGEVVDVLPSSDESGTTLVAMQTDSTPNAISLNRKIIYNTTIGLVVQDYTEFEKSLGTLVNARGGFVASNNTNRIYDNCQSGDWVIRIPTIQYASFLSGVDAMGFAEKRTENAQDVTEEYVDIEARIKNKRVLESRVLGMLEERSGKLGDILEMERELSRVREEIERMEGRLRYLKERIRLATVTIRCREQQEYHPAAAPTLGSRLRQAFVGSMAAMQKFTTSLLVVFVALLPWLLVLSLLAVAFTRVTVLSKLITRKAEEPSPMH